jgi:hypothetical protein
MRLNLSPGKNLVSVTPTWTSFSDLARGARVRHILPIETYFTEVLHMRKSSSDLIEVHGFDLNGPIGRTKNNKFLAFGPVGIFYVFRKKSSCEGCPVFDGGCLPNE